MPRSLPAHLNPYRTERLHALPILALPGGPAGLLDRWRAAGRRGVLVGPPGTGKTSLLEACGRLLAASGEAPRWLRLARDPALTRQRLALYLAQPPGESPLLLDGLEQLGPLAWWRLRRHLRAGILATAHRPGRLPCLHRHPSHPALLADLLAELGEPVPADLEDLWRSQDGDLRACLRLLYDRAGQGLPRSPEGGSMHEPAGRSGVHTR